MTEREHHGDIHLLAVFAVVVAVPGIAVTGLWHAARHLLGDRANAVLYLLAVATDLLALVLGVVVIAVAPWRGGRGIIRGVVALLPALLLLVGYDVLTALLNG